MSQNLFIKDQDFIFDIAKLRSALNTVDRRVKRQTPPDPLANQLYIIFLTQIPDDPNSITGGNLSGLHWTKPDYSGKVLSHEKKIHEHHYSQFISLFDDTYFREIHDALSTKYKLGRVRLLWKMPRTTLIWHRDPEKRLHIPIYSNPGAIMVIDEQAKNLPADGSVWLTDTTHFHSAFNGGEEERVHWVATIIDD